MTASIPKVHRSFVPILTSCDLSRRRLPKLEVRSNQVGPEVWLTACAHGDEVGGIVVVHEVFRLLTRLPLLRGSLRAFPLMNPVGFDVCSRHVTLSEEDLNRSFPGHPEGTLAERLAFTILNEILPTKPALVLDLHNDWTRTIPYAVIDPPASSASEQERGAHSDARDAARKTHFPVVVEPNPLRRTLSHTLVQHGVPAVTIELGESRVVNETNVAMGVAAIRRVLADLEMVTPDPDLAERSITFPVEELQYSSQPLCSTSGILRFHCDPGQTIRAGDPLARVQDAFGRHLETLRAQADALVLGVSDSSVAYPGAPVAALGLFPKN